jgi:Tol biopolymer transport system component
LVSTEETRGAMALVEHGSNQEHDLSWLSYSFGPRLSPDGSEVLFTDLSERSGNDYSVYVRKSDGSPAVRLGGGGYGTDISPDGKWALVLFAGDPAARLQIVPVGPGQARAFHWDGIQPQWAQWFPDGHRILMLANQTGGAEAVFVTDANGATPKQLSPGNTPWKAVAPDEKSVVISQNGHAVIRSLIDGTSRPLPGLQSAEFPIAWSTDSTHIYVQAIVATVLDIYKVDVESGQRELWQVITPKEVVGLRPMTIPIGITPDGRWMAYNSRTQLGQLYSSDTLK